MLNSYRTEGLSSRHSLVTYYSIERAKRQELLLGKLLVSVFIFINNVEKRDLTDSELVYFNILIINFIRNDIVLFR